jgi:hypothetical protein
MNDPRDQFDDALDAQLRGAFAAPPATRFAELARAAAQQPSLRTRVLRWPWLVAAAALLLTIGLFVFRPARGPEGHDGRELGALWAAAFAHAQASGFGRGSCCDPKIDFGRECEQRFSVRLGVDEASAIRLHGCYCGLSTGGCVAVLAETADGPVGVFAVPRRRDPRPVLPADSRLHLSRRELGPLVLYAVSPRAGDTALAPFRVQP